MWKGWDDAYVGLGCVHDCESVTFTKFCVLVAISFLNILNIAVDKYPAYYKKKIKYKHETNNNKIISLIAIRLPYGKKMFRQVSHVNFFSPDFFKKKFLTWFHTSFSTQFHTGNKNESCFSFSFFSHIFTDGKKGKLERLS